MGRILVVGDTGMVGRAVARRLHERRGIEVVVANRAGVGGFRIDASAPPSLDPVLEGIDVVVNAVGILRRDRGSPAEEYRLAATKVNAVFPLVLAEAAAQHGTRVVHISTNAVFPLADAAADEATAPGPADPYGLSKALGESDADHVVNVRCSVIGPAPGRRGGLWEWFVQHPHRAEVHGYADHPWTGVTSAQLAAVCADLCDPAAFDQVRASGAAQHFVPNDPITKFDLLCLLRDVLRPDLRVVPQTAGWTPARQLATRTGALAAVYTGDRGWTRDLLKSAAAPA